MQRAGHYRLLAADEPTPVFEEGLQRGADFLITVDHASARIPRALGDLGLSAGELRRHIAWDIGALGIARRLAEALDAPLIAQNYSRLVIDCNRDPSVSSSIPTVGEYVAIPGNSGLGPAQIDARRREIFWPYQERIKAVLDARLAAGRATILVAQHTMTDVFKGVVRPMHAAILYNRDRRFAGLVLDALRREAGLIMADNEPYFISDATDYTIPVHGEARGLPHVEIEVRQDLVVDPAGQDAWAVRIAAALRSAQRRFQELDVTGGGGR
jgi:predicted N-formylglutamate amidohydrolase